MSEHVQREPTAEELAMVPRAVRDAVTACLDAESWPQKVQAFNVAIIAIAERVKRAGENIGKGEG